MRLLVVAAVAIGAAFVTAPAGAQYYPGPYIAPPPPPPYYGAYAPPRPYYRPYRRNPCPPYWTIQSGVCKPYRGY